MGIVFSQDSSRWAIVPLIVCKSPSPRNTWEQKKHMRSFPKSPSPPIKRPKTRGNRGIWDADQLFQRCPAPPSDDTWDATPGRGAENARHSKLQITACGGVTHRGSSAVYNTAYSIAQLELQAGRVGLGGHPPRPPTEPYLPTLEHTVPLMRDSPCSMLQPRIAILGRYVDT